MYNKNMAKPKSEEKKQSLLAASVKVIVRDGMEASTASIAKEAGVATGTLFTYFPTKATLLNELYVVLKSEMIQSAQAGLDGEISDRDKFHAVWIGWTHWAMLDVDKQKALDILKVSEVLTPQTREFTDTLMQPLFALIQRCLSADADEAAVLFAGELIGTVADTTIRHMIDNPNQAKDYSEAGFRAIWKMIS
jgi:AcrR family transcriptional regulator